MSDIQKVNQINFDYNGKHYCLEYDRDSVRRMEASGYKPGESGDTPLVELEMLWTGAFAKNHMTGPNRVSDRIMKEILDNVKMNKIELLNILRNMMSETYRTLMEENPEGNVELTVSTI